MRYFLTGGTGFVGGHVATHLLDAGHEVVALARQPSKATALDAAGAEVVEGDILDPETMREPMAGVDGVFHVAGWYDIGADDPTLGDRINVEGTRNVLELMADLDVPKGVYTSTLAVNSDTGGQVVDESYRFAGRHLTAYDRTKWEAHYEVAEPMVEDGLPLVTVMPGLVYGPGDTSVFGDALRDYLRGALPVIPRGVAYSPGHVEDIARAHVLAMEAGTPGESYNVCGEPATLVDLFDIVADVSGRDPPRAVSPALFRALAPVAGLLERVVTLPKEYRAESLRVLGGVTYLGDNSKATAELGLDHRPLRTGVAATVEHELARLADGA
ncbi:NAD-dependent epimerase/dehydratase family protein [Halomicroarcula sp. GCM10025709]|uniref:NAD-dependent epimerase/dehydratase family protein n=1 Tax=Haloarcula TaxID=2237 RepID=UPI0024C3BF4E|nr:NAD-dependent epimerase/dehydratase family protein [Halomicroarcula sp. YJ-61-S]